MVKTRETKMDTVWRWYSYAAAARYS